MKTFDAIVVGAGVLGQSATYALAKAGLQVLCVDQFIPPHPWSASVGESRLFRQAYFEDARYIPLLKRAHTLWRELEQRSNTQLLHENGFLVMSDRRSDINEKLLQNATRFDIPITLWSHAELARRYPHIVLPKSYHASFEPHAGVLIPERVLAVLTELSRNLNATMVFGEKVVGIDRTGHQVVVTTDRQSYGAEKIVLAPGSFVNDLVKLPLAITIKRAVQFWFKAPQHYSLARNFPCFAFAQPQEFVYGFPVLHHDAIKIARYEPSDTIENPLKTSVQFTDTEFAPIKAILSRHFPDIDPYVSRHKVCFYDLTHDENFVIDHDPHHDGIVLATGTSGHAFKLAPVIGEIVAQLIQDQPLAFDIDFLRISPARS